MLKAADENLQKNTLNPDIFLLFIAFCALTLETIPQKGVKI
jgi:hypothetical protein